MNENEKAFIRCATGYPLEIQTSNKNVFSGIDYMDNSKNEDIIYYPICRLSEVVHIVMRGLCGGYTNCFINLFCKVMDKGQLYCMRYNEEIEKNVLIYTVNDELDSIDVSETLSKHVIYTNNGERIKREEVEGFIEQNNIKVFFFNTDRVNEEYGEVSSYLNYLSKKYNVSILAFHSVDDEDNKNIKDVIPVDNVCCCRELDFWDYDDGELHYAFLIFEYGELASKKFIFQRKYDENDKPYYMGAFSFMKLIRLHSMFYHITDWTLHRDLVKIMQGYFKFRFMKKTLDQYIYTGVRCGILQKDKVNRTTTCYKYNPEWLHSICGDHRQDCKVENLEKALEITNYRKS